MYAIKTTTPHVLYPDDLKLISDTEAELQTQLQTFKTCSDVISKEFGCDKCAKFVPKQGKLVHSQNLISYITSTEKYKSLNKEKLIKYKGI
jgi:hypothetical protein